MRKSPIVCAMYPYAAFATSSVLLPAFSTLGNMRRVKSMIKSTPISPSVRRRRESNSRERGVTGMRLKLVTIAYDLRVPDARECYCRVLGSLMWLTIQKRPGEGPLYSFESGFLLHRDS